jgi:quinol monooxygenase YgiN
MRAVVVRFYLQNEVAAEGFDALVAETLPKIKKNEPGTMIYAVSRVKDSLLSRVFFEVYESQDALEAHEQQEYVKHFLTEHKRFITGHRVEFLDAPFGKGL